MSPRRQKTELERQLEESIKLAKSGELQRRMRMRDALGNRLKSMDGLDMPDSLADPDEVPGVDDGF